MIIQENSVKLDYTGKDSVDILTIMEIGKVAPGVLQIVKM